ncbi:MAG: MATE family efflux transporter [Bacteroidales bacterium]|nr:MATE family efflux transporter [Bacteroidales bacterium]
MQFTHTKSEGLLNMIRNGQNMTLRQQVSLTLLLSIPGFFAQISHIIMEYIDASMVGSLGAESSASIGLVATTMWLFWGLTSSIASGFSVQVAHFMGANKQRDARDVLRQSIVATLIFSIALAAVGVMISSSLPEWLGGTEEINGGASAYFLIFAASIPVYQMHFIGASMLRCSGNMATPSVLDVCMCLMDVVFNYFFIFILDMGVVGAAIGTLCAETITAVLMMYFLCFKTKEMKIVGEHGSFKPTKQCITKAIRIGLPMGIEHIVICVAQIFTTVIVAPLGKYAIAANSFGVTAESLCYMPGYGIADAATTLVGQSLGAKRKELVKRFAKITVVMGVFSMTIMGIVMYIGAPLMMAILTPVEQIRQLGVSALRIEAFAEPMFAASIVCYGIFVGAGDTIIPAGMNFLSIWAVRLTLAALLAPTMGLNGVWLAMCIELCFRGIIFLIRLKWGRWIKTEKI